MTTPSPAVQYSDNGTTYQAVATSFTGAAVNSSASIKLANSAGANFWSLTCISTDPTSSAAAVNASLSINQTTKVATFTTSAIGSCLLFQSVVGIAGPGLGANGQPVASFTMTFEVNILTSSGGIVMAAGETNEFSAQFGWSGKVNGAVVAASTGGGWIQAYSLDLTAQGSIALTADGNYTIGGQTWAKVNSGNEVTHAFISNIGLSVSPTQGTDYNNGASLSAPGIVLAISEIIPSFHINMPIRVKARVSSVSAINGGCGLVALQKYSTESFFWVGKQYSPSSYGIETAWQLGGSSNGHDTTDQTLNTQDVVEICFPSGLSSFIAASGAGVYSAGWPAENTITMAGFSAPTGWGSVAAPSTAIGTGLSWAIVLGGINGGGSGNPTAVITHLLVEYKN